MLKLKNLISLNVHQAGCGNFDGNCIFCDGQSWDINV